ncbi:hypothetical protein [Sutcliffiella horikoshii]|uniref:Uncharacterized protein n=1 Tax=Sutcliffiella horikoshii TaxID=79883 RepID=A0A5D4TBI7_9BACI|nr:hypothetical protein [Sutcliffiella horikoshii]TYS72957.1 hypothetical protein FZC75_07775 [Sutcliffiella horikoshii]
MKFTLYKLNSKNYPFKQSALKKTFKLFSKNDDEISLFNSTYINDGHYHVVFHLSDEHVSSTKKGGIALTVPFSQYINAFVIEDTFFLESNNKNYTRLIKNYVEKEYDIKLEQFIFNNDYIISLLSLTNGYVKKIETSDINEESETFHGLTIEEIEGISKTKEITFINFLFGNVFISVNNETKSISINTKDEEELLTILGVATNAI